MLPRPDLLPAGAPCGLEIFQLTQGEIPSCHVYMEAQIFTPDSRRFLLHASAHPHGSSKDDPKHRYLLCDLDQGGELQPLTTETGATAPAFSPDGRMLYYFVNETVIGGGRLLLKRVALDGTQRQTVMVVDQPLPGCGRRPSCIYPLSTIRSDGRRLAISCFLGDGTEEGILWGLLCFDLVDATVELILSGLTWSNVHPQYSRSLDPVARRDILVQENHGNICRPDGSKVQQTGGVGADIHVVRDDGGDFRNLPWGRDENEHCQGHQCWRGRTDWAIMASSNTFPPEQQLIEARAVPHHGHDGMYSAGDGRRNHLSRSFAGAPHFYHFATDIAGTMLVTDTSPKDVTAKVWLADLGRAGEDPALNWRCLAEPRSSWQKDTHMHPFLSPDGTMAFFNSDESGVLQAYMVCGLPR